MFKQFKKMGVWKLLLIKLKLANVIPMMKIMNTFGCDNFMPMTMGK